MTHHAETEKVLQVVDGITDEIVEFAADLVRIPTVNPPGALYEVCAHTIGERLKSFGFSVNYVAAEGLPEHSPTHPRVNVIGSRAGSVSRPLLHLNGHFDVVPPGYGWTLDPFGGIVRDGRLYGRGSADMKAGLAAAIYAAEAVRRAGVELRGTIEVSGTVDEESGGMAGVAWLAQNGLISSNKTDYVIIPEPLNVDCVCVGHRGVYWFDITTYGRVAHGSMPFLGINAIDQMNKVLNAIREELVPELATRITDMPVIPSQARYATINTNTIEGGQANQLMQTPCVADRCTVIFDRRFLPEEEFETVRGEVEELLKRLSVRTPDLRYDLQDRLIVQPMRTPEMSPVVVAVRDGVRSVLDREATLVASPGTYDHKHVTNIGGVTDCIAYGPGALHLAHQPDEWCGIDDLVASTKVLALSILKLVA